MRLITFHKILIGTALVFTLFFGIKELTRNEGSQIVGILSLLIAIGVGYYFVWVLRGGYTKNTK